jgi:membrane protease YdiL (CAAX protease family)
MDAFTIILAVIAFCLIALLGLGALFGAAVILFAVWLFFKLIPFVLIALVIWLIWKVLKKKRRPG